MEHGGTKQPRIFITSPDVRNGFIESLAEMLMEPNKPKFAWDLDGWVSMDDPEAIAQANDAVFLCDLMDSGLSNQEAEAAFASVLEG